MLILHQFYCESFPLLPFETVTATHNTQAYPLVNMVFLIELASHYAALCLLVFLSIDIIVGVRLYLARSIGFGRTS